MLDQTWLPASPFSASLFVSLEAPGTGTPTSEPYPPKYVEYLGLQKSAGEKERQLRVKSTVDV